MNLFANPVAIRLRTLIRRTPLVHRALVRVRSVFTPAGYETALSNDMTSSVRAGDCVWDIGANVGVYTKVFAELAGPSGRVLAFDPSPGCFEALTKLKETLGDNVSIHQVAMGDRDGETHFSLETGDTGVGNHVTDAAAPNSVVVRMARGDTLLADGQPIPNVLKIDVEGFEGEVIDGMKSLLAQPAVRSVFIEVHFAKLAQRGKANVPTDLVSQLRGHGFDVKWVDSSHIAARRGQGA